MFTEAHQLTCYFRILFFENPVSSQHLANALYNHKIGMRRARVHLLFHEKKEVNSALGDLCIFVWEFYGDRYETESYIYI